ncbi:MAG: hypothetical protein Q9186_003120 [Xanthomendoza sp. 1 TL-2023]
MLERVLLTECQASKAGRYESIIDVLSGQSYGSPSIHENRQDLEPRQSVITQAVDLLQNLHHVCCTSEENSDQPSATHRGQKLVDALLDLVVLEGIYPSVSPGVGLPIEQRINSVLKGDLLAKPLSRDHGGQFSNQKLLTLIIDCLYPIASCRKGLASKIETRVSVDLLAAVGELAFSPTFATESRHKYLTMFNDFISSKSVLDLLPMFTSLLHPSCPHWLRSPISGHLSLLPLRPNGVRQTINFIADSVTSSMDQVHEQSNHSPGPLLSLDTLSKVSKLLTSIPGSMRAEEYFSILAPQMLDLLDDPAIDNKRIASYIIGDGILGKRKIGSPGTIGWRMFAQPILESLNPPPDKCPVLEKDLKLAVDRLSALVHFHPNPGLTKRLVFPILLPLWALQGYALDHDRTNWVTQVHQILSTYMKISMTESQILLLSDHLLWDGPASWTFMPGDSGGIEIRRRVKPADQIRNTGDLIQTIDNRVEQYSRLLQKAVLVDDQLSQVFIHASKRWLHRSQPAPRYETLEMEADSSDPLLSLVSAKITQKLLEDFKDRISSSYGGILQLIEPILSSFVKVQQQTTEQQLMAPSLRSLSTIAMNDEGGDGGAGESETVSTALSLLSVVLAPSGNCVKLSNNQCLQSIQDSLEYIARATSSLDGSITASASNTLILLQLHSDISEHSQFAKRDAIIDTHADDRKEHRTALIHLSDDLIPVRAQGLSILTVLISKASPVLSIPSTSILLASLLQDEDEYIYLSAIRALGLLSTNHPKTVLKMLIERYTDPCEESTLDIRIKVGEALNRTIEHLGPLFVGEAATMIGESMIAVASRRGDREKTLQKRETAQRKLEKTWKDVENAWDGEVPGGDDGENDQEDEIKKHVATVVEGWADTGREEDIRIRTSALSILGTAIETNIAGLGAGITSTAIDCVLAILKLEKSQERAILRRAGVMVIMSIIKALDAANEQGHQLGFGFAGENLTEVITVLRYVEVTEMDEIVVGHIRVVIGSLETWQQKSIPDMLRRAGRQTMDLGLDETKVAGFAKRPVMRPSIEEID